MKMCVSTICILLLSVTILFAADLKTYQANYDKQMGTIILEHGANISKLNNSYEKYLTDLSNRAADAGDLDKTQAVLAEVKRFKDEVTVSNEHDMPELQKLQQGYKHNLQNMEAAKAKKMMSLYSKYDSALGKLQATLTKERKLDEAVTVKAERDSLKKDDDIAKAEALLSTIAKAEKKPATRTFGKTTAKKEKKVMPSALSKDLLLHYTFDDFRGSKAEDDSGKRNHGRVIGFPKKVNEQRGASISLDGKKDLIVAQPRKPDLNRVIESDYTLALWFKPLSKPEKEKCNGGAGLIIKAGCDVGLYYTTQETFEMFTWLMVKANVTADNASGLTMLSTASAPIVSDNEWIHVTGVVIDKEKTVRLYLDGELVKETIWEHEWKLAPNGAPWRIGMADIGRCMTHGCFDDVRIYSRALPPEEVNKLYVISGPTAK